MQNQVVLAECTGMNIFPFALLELSCICSLPQYCLCSQVLVRAVPVFFQVEVHCTNKCPLKSIWPLLAHITPHQKQSTNRLRIESNNKTCTKCDSHMFKSGKWKVKEYLFQANIIISKGLLKGWNLDSVGRKCIISLFCQDIIRFISSFSVPFQGLKTYGGPTLTCESSSSVSRSVVSDSLWPRGL